VEPPIRAVDLLLVLVVIIVVIAVREPLRQP
jgi:hypothetical protein